MIATRGQTPTTYKLNIIIVSLLLYNIGMKSEKIRYVSPDTPAAVTEYLRERGYEVLTVRPLPNVAAPIASHPDIQMCRLGCHDNSPVFIPGPDSLAVLSRDYPGDVRYNAACTGKYFIHNLAYTDPELLRIATDLTPNCNNATTGLAPNCNNATTGLARCCINVKQGYAKCSCVVVDEDSIITYDAGIARACMAAGVNVLVVRPGHVVLNGYDTGFIGGASGRIDDTIVFCGDVLAHPDGRMIVDWIESRGLECKWFDFPLTDIGSII